MKLKKIILHNYRCYVGDVSIDIDDLTCIIGKNDVGKSSIMEALDAFFNDNNINKTDLSATAPTDDQQICISCVFSDMPAEMVLDSSVECNLDEEGLLNGSRDLEIKRVWDCGGKTLGKSTYLKCNYYEAPEAEGLLSQKKDSLKSLIRNNNIKMLAGGRQTINRDMRRAIRTHYNMINRSERFIKVDGNLSKEYMESALRATSDLCSFQDG